MFVNTVLYGATHTMFNLSEVNLAFLQVLNMLRHLDIIYGGVLVPHAKKRKISPT